MNNEVTHIVSQLKNGERSVSRIPQKYREHPEIISVERALGLRKTYRCGYDVIRNRFFVEEDILLHKKESNWTHLEPVLFDSFTDYSVYLEGNVYDNSPYYLMVPEKVPKNVDKERLYRNSSFINYTVNDFSEIITVDEQNYYNKVEKIKEEVKKWIDEFNKSTNFRLFCQTVQNYKKSGLNTVVDVSFYFWVYIFEDINDNKRFKTIMEYMSSGFEPASSICSSLCAIYDPDAVMDNYHYKLGSYNTCRRHIRAMKLIADNVKNGRYDYYRKAFFDEKTHFFCIEKLAYERGNEAWPVFSFKHYYEDISAFLEALKGDLTGCNLSNAQNIRADFSRCLTDDTTILPIDLNKAYSMSLMKCFCDNSFKVIQTWKDGDGHCVKRKQHVFEYFCDFMAFLNGDITGADLLSCDGLENIKPAETISFKGALVTSRICDKWGIAYETNDVNGQIEASFEITEKNEIDTAPILSFSREMAEKDTKMRIGDHSLSDVAPLKVYYISDIHLYHLIRNQKAKSKNDVIKTLRDLASSLICESERFSIILINGDTSLDFSLFTHFVSELGRKRKNQTIVFTIGNHDLWSRPNDTVDQLSEKYRVLLKENGMYLLHNDILVFNEYYLPPERISEGEVVHSTVAELRMKARFAKLILFGGVGFSGYNPVFNAEIGLYRYNNTIGYSREIELKETQRFESLYLKISDAFRKMNTIIMTHMPLPCWLKSGGYQHLGNPSNDTCLDSSNDNMGVCSSYSPGFIYVSGHTHQNFFYDDGSIRIYADNQFGYNDRTPNAWPRLKSFEVDPTTDCFSDYDDGIYEITPEEYRQFYRCKNLKMELNREINQIFMLKKEAHYCFIHKGNNNTLSIMNGGALSRLEKNDIYYYYSNLSSAISLIKEPLGKYSRFQEQVADVVKKIGGAGAIHGCIIDIDFFNHIFVNPIDGTMIGYWASDIINKTAYPTISALLKARCEYGGGVEHLGRCELNTLVAVN